MSSRRSTCPIATPVGLPSAGGAATLDDAGVALNILPPGQSGDLSFPPNASHQLCLYDDRPTFHQVISFTGHRPR